MYQRLAGSILIAISIVMLATMFGGAAYCEYDPRAIKGECLRSIYTAIILD